MFAGILHARTGRHSTRLPCNALAGDGTRTAAVNVTVRGSRRHANLLATRAPRSSRLCVAWGRHVPRRRACRQDTREKREARERSYPNREPPGPRASRGVMTGLPPGYWPWRCSRRHGWPALGFTSPSGSGFPSSARWWPRGQPLWSRHLPTFCPQRTTLTPTLPWWATGRPGTTGARS